MHRYHKLGKVAKKRHTVFRDDNGNIYHEELKGNMGSAYKRQVNNKQE